MASPAHTAQYARRLQSQSRRAPSGPSSIIVGKYYYGIDCPVCHEVGPLIVRLNDNMVGGMVYPVSVNAKVEHKGDRINKSSVKQTWKHGGISATPTVIWENNVKDVGVKPHTNENGINKSGLAEYWCRNAARNFLQQKEPNMSKDHINEIIRNVFHGPPSKDRKTGERTPFSALRYITVEY